MIPFRPAVLRPADYYSAPSAPSVLPRGATFGCGAASLLLLILVAAGGAFLASGGIVDLMDLVFGMSMGELRGMYTPEVSAEQKKALDTAIESLRSSVREGKVPVSRLESVLQTMRDGIADKKMQPLEVEGLTNAARRAMQPAPKRPPFTSL